jgi:MFS family permease
MTTISDDQAPNSSGLRRNRDFQMVMAGQAASALGDAIALTAMPLIVLMLTGSGVLLGIVGALELVPDLVLGLPAGALADRFDRRLLMLWADAGRAGLTAIVPVSLWLDGPTIALILILAIPINTLRVLSDAALSSALPGLVGREHLGQANSLFEATMSVPFIIGPALAGVLVGTAGEAATMALNSTSFAFSALSLSIVRRTLRAERPEELPHILVDIREGLRFVWRHHALRALIGYWGAVSAATAALVPALSFFVTVDLERGPELFGIVGSAWSIGYLGGSLASGRFSADRLGHRILGSGVAMLPSQSPSLRRRLSSLGPASESPWPCRRCRT